MSGDALQVVVGLRRLEERQRRVELAKSIIAAAQARTGLGDPPHATGKEADISTESFLVGRATSHMAWAVFGARLERSEKAEAAEVASRAAWVSAAADLRAAERLLARRRRRSRVAIARRAQRDLDEAAISGWRRREATWSNQ